MSSTWHIYIVCEINLQILAQVLQVVAHVVIGKRGRSVRRSTQLDHYASARQRSPPPIAKGKESEAVYTIVATFHGLSGRVSELIEILHKLGEINERLNGTPTQVLTPVAGKLSEVKFSWQIADLPHYEVSYCETRRRSRVGCLI
jgi:hypothetical protein